MKKVLTIFLAFFLISSCSIDWDGEKDRKIAELEKQISEFNKNQEENLFKKKQECVEYKEKMLEFAEKYYKVQEYESKLEIEEIFYSTKNNSCYFTTILDEGKNKFKTIFDYFWQKLYMQSSLYESQRLSQEVKDLKWE